MTLISRLEQAEAGSRELSCTLAKEIGWEPQAGEMGADTSSPWAWCPNFTESIDAAMSLVPEGWVIVDVCQRLPCLHQWEWAVRLGVLEDGAWRYVRGCSAKAPGGFALALCIASLKAAGYE